MLQTCVAPLSTSEAASWPLAVSSDSSVVVPLASATELVITGPSLLPETVIDTVCCAVAP